MMVVAMNQSSRANSSQVFVRASSIRFIAVLIVLLVVVLGISTRILRSVQLDVPGGAPLVVDPSVLNIGDVWAQRDFQWKVKVRNASEHPVSVTIAPTCACTSVVPARFVIPALGDQVVTLMIDLRPRREQLGKPSYSTVVGLHVLWQSPSGSSYTDWQIRAEVRNAVGTDALMRLLPDAFVAQAENEPVELFSVTALHPVKSLAVKSSAAWLTARAVQQDADHWNIIVGTSAKAPLGIVDELLSIEPVLRDDTIAPPLTVAIGGELRSDVRAFPSEIAFGIVHPRETPAEEIMLYSQRNLPFSWHAKQVPEYLVVEAVRETATRKIISVQLKSGWFRNRSEKNVPSSLLLRCITNAPGSNSAPMEVEIPVSAYCVE